MFAKLRHCCGIELLKTIYHALVESHLQYCNIIWCNVNETILEPLIKLQDKIISPVPSKYSCGMLDVYALSRLIRVPDTIRKLFILGTPAAYCKFSWK